MNLFKSDQKTIEELERRVISLEHQLTGTQALLQTMANASYNALIQNFTGAK